MLPADFIAAIYPGAKACEDAHGIPTAFTIAQAALESGWATSRLSRSAYNLFGIKAQKNDGWTGPTVPMLTEEYINGKKVIEMARWRSYRGWAECIEDRARFFKTDRYAKARACTDSRSFAKAIQAAGYATDPHYADKLIAIIDQHHLDPV